MSGPRGPDRRRVQRHRAGDRRAAGRAAATRLVLVARDGAAARHAAQALPGRRRARRPHRSPPTSRRGRRCRRVVDEAVERVRPDRRARAHRDGDGLRHGRGDAGRRVRDRRRHRDPRHGRTSPARSCRCSAGRARGTFVIVNSLLGSITVPNMGAYATAKWGQRAIARTLQQEIARRAGRARLHRQPGQHQHADLLPGRELHRQGRAAAGPGAAARAGRPASSPIWLDRPRKHVSVPVGPANPVVITGFRLLPSALRPAGRPAVPARRADAAPTSRRTSGNVVRPHPPDDRRVGRWPDRAGD